MGVGFMDVALEGPLANGWNGQLLTADPFGLNPYVTDLSATYPGVFRAASQRQPAPTLFAGGDLPPFIASGLRPDLLVGLPFTMRHAAASEPSAQKMLEWIEAVGNDPAVHARDTIEHPGLHAYRERLNTWVAGINPDAVGGDAYPVAFLPARQRRQGQA